MAAADMKFKCLLTHSFYRVLLLLYSFQSWSSVSGTRIRGVAITKLPFYDPSKGTFSCFDGSLTIPFSSVNDNYCDCSDSSDEPGTAACPNGKFHCTNAGYIPKNIPSSRVNDGLCDCCDGSDEYEGKVICENTCKILGKELIEKRKREQEIASQGFVMKQEYSQQGHEKKKERQQKLEELKNSLEEKKSVSEELKEKKDSSELVEKEAKEKHQQWWDGEKAKRQAERDRVAAEKAFSELDTDNSGSVTTKELVQTKLLDKAYTEEEAKELLGGVDEISEDQFVAEIWTDSFKNVFVGDVVIAEQTQTDTETAKHEESTETKTETHPDELDLPEADEEEADDDDEEVEDEIKADAMKRSNENVLDQDKKDEDEPMPEYDEATKSLIEAADKARKEHEEAENSQKNVEREISAIEKILNIDFGEDEEFFPLHGQCYEYTDREYRYKLCPFDKITQQPKSGGSETNLGSWGEWTGQPSKYTQMRYSGGLGCWNGPSRSTVVDLSCGPANELIQSSEPNRCEYLMEFTTPAVCQQISSQTHEHTEL